MDRLASILSAISGVLLVVAAILGPLGVEQVKFHMGKNAIAQYQGGEVVTLAAAAILLYADWLFWRHHSLAAPLVIGPATYVVYTMITVVLGQEWVQFEDANAMSYQLLYMGITAATVMLIAIAVNNVIQRDVMVSSLWRKLTMGLLGLKAAFFTYAWVAAILDVANNGWTGVESEQRSLFWLVKDLDLGFIVPLGVLTVALLVQRQVLGPTLVLILTGFSVFMMTAIAAMAVGMKVQDEADSIVGVVITMLVLAALSFVVWWPWVRATERAG